VDGPGRKCKPGRPIKGASDKFVAYANAKSLDASLPSIPKSIDRTELTSV
jgi:hypothetical protein